MRSDVLTVKLPCGEVGELVAQDFLEKLVAGVPDERRDPDQAPLGIAAAKTSSHTGRPLDRRSVDETGSVPVVEPAPSGQDRFDVYGGVHDHEKANTMRRLVA